MNEVVIGIIGLVALLGLFLTGIEIAFAMAIIGFFGFAYVVSFQSAVDLLANDFFDSLSSYGLTVIPLFVLMGQIAFNAGLARRFYDSTHKFIGHVPGGLAIATVAGATIFKAICGSVVATTATFASVAVPEMDRYGYSRKLSTGIVAVCGTLGALLPPSVSLIIFGIITQLPITGLFMAGMLPGLLLAFLYASIAFGWCKINPAIGPRSEKFTWKARLASLPVNLWALLIFLVIIGGLMKGVFTPTEAGGIGTFAVLVLCYVKRDINAGGFVKSIYEAMGTSCMVMLMIAGSAVLGHFITVTNVSSTMADWIMTLPLHRVLVTVLIMIVYLLGGSVVDDLAFVVLATPIFFPIIVKLGYDPFWVGILISLTMAIGSVIPPVAINVFVVKNITKAPMGVIYSGCYPFLISLVVCVVLLFLFPGLATYLPATLLK